MARRIAACALGAALLAPAAAAPARAASHRVRAWATVNVCDTKRHPDAIGVRASMPGSPRAGVRLFMRFQVQWRDPADHRWHDIPHGGDSGFVFVGSGRYRAREAGRIFRFEAPAAGTTETLRGVVRFEWRRRGKLARGFSLKTTAHHRSAAGSDPKGYSAALCTLS